MLDRINAFFLHNPSLLAQVKFIIWLKYWILLGIAGFYIFLVYIDGYKKKRDRKLSVREM